MAADRRPFEEHPRIYDECPKCRHEGRWDVAFHETGHQPSWGQMYPVPEDPHLCWICRRCGYRIETRTADA